MSPLEIGFAICSGVLVLAVFYPAAFRPLWSLAPGHMSSNHGSLYHSDVDVNLFLGIREYCQRS